MSSLSQIVKTFECQSPKIQTMWSLEACKALHKIRDKDKAVENLELFVKSVLLEAAGTSISNMKLCSYYYQPCYVIEIFIQPIESTAIRKYRLTITDKIAIWEVLGD